MLINFTYFLIHFVALAYISASVHSNNAAALKPSRLLLVVGDVRSHRARILYDTLDKSLRGTSLVLQLYKIPHNLSGSSLRLAKDLLENWIVRSYSGQITMGDGPKVVTITNLQAGSFYALQFTPTDVVTFYTLNENQGIVEFISERSNDILLVSCDRYNDDRDDSMWKELITQDRNQRIGMIHLGDQVYADAGVDQVSVEGSLSFHEYVDAFRNVYRKTWGRETMQLVLRHGFHWMIPDDHDVVNNLDKSKYFLMSVLVQAGLHAYREYQLQLVSDIDFGALSIWSPAFFFRQLGPFGFVFLDLRFERTFRFEENSPLFGEDQLKAYREQLRAWGQNDNIQSVFVFSSVPLFYHTEWSAKIADIVEKEHYPGHAKFQDTLRNFVEVTIHDDNLKIKHFFAGDMHLYSHSKSCTRNFISNRCFNQTITSGMTHRSTTISEIKLVLYAFFVTRLSFGYLSSYMTSSFDTVFYGKNFARLSLWFDGTYDVVGHFYAHENPLHRSFQAVSDYFIKWETWITPPSLVFALIACIISAAYVFHRSSA